LQRNRQLPYFIQEERPAMGSLERSDSSAPSTGERACFMAEQLAFDERGWKRTAVHDHERAGAP
jgi:hypothetical protein